MKYDFDNPPDRRGTHSLKWDVEPDELPLWVADMDFSVAPEIVDAVKKRAAHGIYGYAVVPDEWYSAISGWWRTRHGFDIEKEWLCFCTGVIPAVTSAVKRLTAAGDGVVLQTPVYDIFFHSVENAGRRVVESPLRYDNGAYSIDFADLEQKLSDKTVTMMILCNPHNPTGLIFSADELKKIGALCKKHGVVVLSDEIHCDITEPGYDYTPFASVSGECRDNCVMTVAASKAFNLAGLQAAAVVVPDSELRRKVVRALNADEVAEPNCFGAEATIAAFTRGGDWLDEMRAYVAENVRIATDYINKNIPEIMVVTRHATYLMWLDCSGITPDATELCAFIRKRTGLFVTAGEQYRGNGKAFIRVNVACPRSRLFDALDRLTRGVKGYKTKTVKKRRA